VARTRNLKPSFFTNDQLGDIEPLGRLLFQGLWCHADRAGRLLDRGKKLKAEILPYDECDVEKLLGDLRSHGFIQRYIIADVPYIQISKFLKHQHPHGKEPESELPAPDKHRPRKVPAPDKDSTSPENSITDRALILNPLALSLNPQALSGEPQSETPPEGIHSLGYARKICEEIGLPVEGNLKVIASAIEAVSTLHSLSIVGAHIALLGRAKEAVERGEAVDRWWFQDAKWRNRNGKQPDSKAAQRARGNAAAIRAGLGIGGNADDVLPVSGAGFTSGGDKDLGSDVCTGETRETALGVPRAPKNVKLLSKASGHY
jgi:hypothetical protein